MFFFKNIYQKIQQRHAQISTIVIHHPADTGQISEGSNVKTTPTKGGKSEIP